jgi:hypothetical protein
MNTRRLRAVMDAGSILLAKISADHLASLTSNLALLNGAFTDIWHIEDNLTLMQYPPDRQSNQKAERRPDE